MKKKRPIIEERGTIYWCPYCMSGYYIEEEAEACRDKCESKEEIKK